MVQHSHPVSSLRPPFNSSLAISRFLSLIIITAVAVLASLFVLITIPAPMTASSDMPSVLTLPTKSPDKSAPNGTPNGMAASAEPALDPAGLGGKGAMKSSEGSGEAKVQGGRNASVELDEDVGRNGSSSKSQSPSPTRTSESRHESSPVPALVQKTDSDCLLLLARV